MYDIEFQTDPKEDIPFRMADYRLRIYRRFPEKRVYQVVIYLRKTQSPAVKINRFELPELQYHYNVIRLWEVPTEAFLKAPGLLPFAVLSRTEKPAEVLQEVARHAPSPEGDGLKSKVPRFAAARLHKSQKSKVKFPTAPISVFKDGACVEKLWSN